MSGRRHARQPAPAVDRRVLVAIAAGGGLGAVGRWAVGAAWPPAPGQLPWATLGVNAVGCLAIGAVLVVLTEVAGSPHPLVRPFVGTGVLGGFTTFSTYAVETERLLADGAIALAAAYAVGTLVVALLAAQAGVAGARLATRRPQRRVRRVGPARTAARGAPDQQRARRAPDQQRARRAPDQQREGS